MLIRAFLVKKKLIQSTMRQSGAERRTTGRLCATSSRSVRRRIQLPTTEAGKGRTAEEGGGRQPRFVRLRRRSSSSLPEARQLINSQLGACFPTKVGIKIRKTVSFSFTYSTVTMREKGDIKGCESLFLTSSFAPNISKAREL